MTVKSGPPVHVHHVVRNPWGGARASSSSASGSSRTYHCPADYYGQEPPLYSQPARTPSPQYDVIEGPRLNRALASRPASAASTARTEGAVDPCGGHCTAFENFCHYTLQALFVIGILSGVSLTIAGSVLRGKRGGDLHVLVYIGCLTSMVCTLLLSVQCCVRRKVEGGRQWSRRQHQPAIPLQQLPPAPLAPPRLPAPGQYEPLLRQLVQQQIDQTQPTTSIVREDHSGTPWWRRQPPVQATKLPHTRVQMPL